MGYMRHHTIVVTGWNEEDTERAHKRAKDILGDFVSEIVGPFTNGYRSFFVAPDGSKEGWETSDLLEERRNSFIGWLQMECYGDGSPRLDWVEVQFGDDMNVTKTLRDSDMIFRESE